MGSMDNRPSLPPAPSSSDDDTVTGLPGKGGADGFGGFGRTFLSDSVGRGQANKPDDVLQVSRFLAKNDILPAPSETADEDFFRAVEKGQDRLNELAGGGLHRDGIIKPWGPTEVLSQRAVSSGKMRPFDTDQSAPADGNSAQVADTQNGRRPVPPQYPPRLPPLPARQGDGANIRTIGTHGTHEETPLERKSRFGSQGVEADQLFRPDKMDPDSAAAFMRRLEDRRTTVLEPKANERSIPVTIGGYQLTRESSYLLGKAMTATAETRKAVMAEVNKSGLGRTQKGAVNELITRRLESSGKDPVRFGDRKVIARLMSQMDERNAKTRDTVSGALPFLFPTLQVEKVAPAIKLQDAIGTIIRETIKKQTED